MMGIPAVALLVFIISFFAKVPGGVTWAGLVLLAAIIQVGLAIVAFGVPAVGALHGINALILFAVSFMAGHRVTGVRAEPAPSRVRTTV